MDRKISVQVHYPNRAPLPPRVMRAIELGAFVSGLTDAALFAPGGELPARIVTTPVDEAIAP